MKLSAIIIISFVTQQAFAQFTDDFSDGDFSSAPSWTGTPGVFIVDASELRLQAPAAAGVAYLSTASESVNNAIWEFYVKLAFNPSTTNYARVYIVADNDDLSGSLNGYFIGIGNSSDEISLFKQTGTTIVEIIDGLDNRLNLTSCEARIKVTRAASGDWELFADVGNTSTYTSEGTATDATHTQSYFNGVYCVYTSTRSDKFYFDDFSVMGDAFVDNIPPEWNSIAALSDHELELIFSEPLEPTAVEIAGNYGLSTGQHPISVSLLPGGTTVHLSFENPFTNGVTDTLSILSLSDTAENFTTNLEKTFLFFQEHPVEAKDVVVTEVFPDYSPAIGLPEAEFIEIFNRSMNPVQLSNWSLTDGSSIATLPEKILLPGQYLILCSTIALLEFLDHGQTLGIGNFPSLNNASDMIKLVDDDGNQIDSLTYSLPLYRDEDKQAGGWTLELIDPDNFCKADENWMASINPMGGTPGEKNSVDSNFVDSSGPKIKSISQTDSLAVTIQFDERLAEEEVSLQSVAVVPDLSVDEVVLSNDLKQITISVGNVIEEGKTYRFELTGITDCEGNVITSPYRIGYLNLDTIPPLVDSVTITSSNSLRLFINEKLDSAAIKALAIFRIDTLESTVVNLNQSQKVIDLTFDTVFVNGHEHMLSISSLTDINGNELTDTISFLYFIPSPVRARDLIITEIFADPLPVVGLPEVEFIEIYNRSNNPIDVKGWKIKDANAEATLSRKIILPKSYCILTSTISAWGITEGLNILSVPNFPTLSNTGELLKLMDPAGRLIDSILYRSTMYAEDDKGAGGWSLELMDPENICLGDKNWTASRDPNGGTPGRRNSVDSVITDLTGPTLLVIHQIDDYAVDLQFNERLSNDENDWGAMQVTINPEIAYDSIYFSDDHLNALRLHSTDKFKPELSYKFEIRNIRDCSGNTIADELQVGYLNLDTIPPAVDSTAVISSRELFISFAEKIDHETTRDVSNYTMGNNFIDSAWISEDSTSVIIRFDNDFTNGMDNALVVQNLSDLNGNVFNDTIHFRYFQSHPVSYRDIIITEIFADPTPAVGLPEAEFVEIFNRSDNPINLEGWKLRDATSSGLLKPRILMPGNFLILTATSADYPDLPTMRVTMMPSLNNSGEQLSLIAADDDVIDSVQYSSSMYDDEEKSYGGWTLERIDFENTCLGNQNWTASVDSAGGTPGFDNSVAMTIVDSLGPRLLSIVVEDNWLTFRFDERLAQSSIDSIIFSSCPEIESGAFLFTDEYLTSMKTFLSSPPNAELTYRIEVSDISDCEGNEIDANHNFVFLNRDTINPAIDSITVFSDRELLLHFSEKLHELSDSLWEFKTSSGIQPDSITLLHDSRSLHLQFASPFENGKDDMIFAKNVYDLNGNMALDSIHFMFFQPRDVFEGDVIITEIFADPSPQVGLGENEYLEIYNRSENAIDLSGWQLRDATSTTVFPSKILLPSSRLVLTNDVKTNPILLSVSNSLGMKNFPGLNNTGESLSITSSDGRRIDSIRYDLSWYRDEEKELGGYSLERIDVNNFCKGGLNWMASRDSVGGTPGKINSVDSVILDTEGPELIAINQHLPFEVAFLFDERLTAFPIQTAEVNIEPHLPIDTILVNATENELIVRVTTPIHDRRMHRFVLNHMKDCEGNVTAEVIGYINIDTIPPSIDTIKVVSSSELFIRFNEQLNSASAVQLENYTLEQNSVSHVSLLTDSMSLRLTSNGDFENGVVQWLIFNDIMDVNGNPFSDSIAFRFFEKKPTGHRDVIISEIFADPLPVIGLPESEYIEIYNRSPNAVNLHGWTVSDASDTAILGEIFLLPARHLVLTSRASLKFYAPGTAFGVSSFPSLSNSGEKIVIRDDSGLIIDSLGYSSTWYQDEEKSEGGWSLEIMDIENICLGWSNWVASRDTTGGTPGKINSVDTTFIDMDPPLVTRIHEQDAFTILFHFNERLDPGAIDNAEFTIEPSIPIDSLLFSDNALNDVIVKLVDPLDPDRMYKMQSSRWIDCPGNEAMEITEHLLHVDTLAPVITNVAVISADSIKIDFSERLLDETSSAIQSYFIVGYEIREAVTINDQTVYLTLTDNIPNGSVITVIIDGVSDINGNIISDSVNVQYFYPQPIRTRDIVITEIFADPSPVMGLPEAEFVEIYNRSENPIETQGLTMSDGSTSGKMSSNILLPGEYLILSSPAALPSYKRYGKVGSLTAFPSLNNDEDYVILKNKDGQTLDSVYFSATFYRNEEKADGGFSLEIIDPENTCLGGENWIATIDTVLGGTPGKINSVFRTIIDTEAPRLVKADLLDSSSFELRFNEPVSDGGLITIEPNIDIVEVTQDRTDKTRLSVVSENYLNPYRTYSIAVDGFFDCAGHNIDPEYNYASLNPDSVPPVIESYLILNDRTISVAFNELIDTTTSLQADGYFVMPNEFADSVVIDETEHVVTISFGRPFQNGIETKLKIINMLDVNGNRTDTLTLAFTFFEPHPVEYNDIVINEIFADPLPTTGLPEYEFLEIFNRSQNPVDLNGWFLADASGEVELSHRILLPGDYLILCGPTAALQFEKFGPTLGVDGFPTLSNGGERLQLKTPERKLIDSVSYSIEWFGDDEKMYGGYSLELRDPDNRCLKERNWKGAESEVGGTPGKINSIFEIIVDQNGPKLRDVDVNNGNQIEFFFDEPLSAESLNSARVSSEPQLEFTSISFKDNSLTGIIAVLNYTLDKELTHSVSVSNVFDCTGNEIDSLFSTGYIYLDTVPPYVLSVDVTSENLLTIHFSESIDTTSIANVRNYHVDELQLIRAKAGEDKATILLEFEGAFPNGKEQILNIGGLTDRNKNQMLPASFPFMFFHQGRTVPYDVVITEILADPAPTAGLPDGEFIEIYNRSTQPISTQGWKLKVGGKIASVSPLIMLPDDYLILCTTSREAAFNSFGRALGIPNFPTLNNVSAEIVLIDNVGAVIDSVAYKADWLATSEDREGGISLERIDHENFCSEETNWTSSDHDQGGSPGAKNSVAASNPDLTSPVILNVQAVTEDTIRIAFNERLEQSLPGLESFIVEGNTIMNMLLHSDLKHISLIVKIPLKSGMLYNLHVDHIFDCSGNKINPTSFFLALPEDPEYGDVVISEILFNPTSTGVDFVEVYNQSDKYLKLQGLKWKVAEDSTSTTLPLTEGNELLHPKSYVAVTTDANVLLSEYFRSSSENIIEGKLPSMPDDEGALVLISKNDSLIDSIVYNAGMHSAFLQNDDGVSLEKVDLSVLSMLEENWRSASEDSGYATPGYKNSQSKSPSNDLEKLILIEPQIFQPVNGSPSFTTISYKFDDGGNIGNLTILDAYGRIVKHIANNEVLGAEGFFQWEGDTDDGTLTPMGSYMVYLEIYDEQGNVQRFRRQVAVVSKF